MPSSAAPATAACRRLRCKPRDGMQLSLGAAMQAWHQCCVCVCTIEHRGTTDHCSHTLAAYWPPLAKLGCAGEGWGWGDVATVWPHWVTEGWEVWSGCSCLPAPHGQSLPPWLMMCEGKLSGMTWLPCTAPVDERCSLCTGTPSRAPSLGLHLVFFIVFFHLVQQNLCIILFIPFLICKPKFVYCFFLFFC